jgi:hypothetical protein
VGVVAVDVEAGPAVAPAAAPAPTPAPAAAHAGPMRWNNATSGFVLRRMAQLVSDGSRPDKVFKDKDVNLVAKQLYFTVLPHIWFCLCCSLAYEEQPHE